MVREQAAMTTTATEAAAVSTSVGENEKQMVGGCCVCTDDTGYRDNALVYCDGEDCEVAVHQACYGIGTVPDGNWYCRRCEHKLTLPKSEVAAAAAKLVRTCFVLATDGRACD